MRVHQKILLIGADDCRPCRRVKAVLERLQRESRLAADLETLSITVDNLTSVIDRSIESLPTIILYRSETQLLRYPDDSGDRGVMEILVSSGFINASSD